MSGHGPAQPLGWLAGCGFGLAECIMHRQRLKGSSFRSHLLAPRAEELHGLDLALIVIVPPKVHALIYLQHSTGAGASSAVHARSARIKCLRSMHVLWASRPHGTPLLVCRYTAQPHGLLPKDCVTVKPLAQSMQQSQE